MPIDVCNAESQGFIGYMMESALKNDLYQRGIDSNVVSFLTMVEVSKDDPAFDNPTKPIGVFFSEEEAKRMEKNKVSLWLKMLAVAIVVLYLHQNQW